jgi:TonB family protein
MSKKSHPLDLLDNVRVAAPCSADWSAMRGNDRARFCQECNLNVYNISAMTQAEAEELINRNEGRLCVRYYQRADGTILTQDCPVGVKAWRKKAARVALAISSAAISFFAGIGLRGMMKNDESIIERRNMGIAKVGHFKPPMRQPATTPSQPDRNAVMGGLTYVPPPNPTAPPPPPPPFEPGREIIGDPAPPSVVRRSEGVIRGNAIFRATPEYPPLARTAHVQGDVVTEITIDEEGKVISARIISGHPLFQQSTLNAARQWKFKPMLFNGNAVKVSGVLTFRFAL